MKIVRREGVVVWSRDALNVGLDGVIKWIGLEF
jgi:hypothetical protein